MDDKVKHLEMIQGVINRMAGNSFALKGWAVSLNVGLLVLSGNQVNRLYYLAAYIPIFVFWSLDAYYLLQERLYRSLYDKVRRSEKGDIDFSMSASPAEFGSDKNCFRECVLSLTILGFYLPLAIICTAVMLLACNS